MDTRQTINLHKVKTAMKENETVNIKYSMKKISVFLAEIYTMIGYIQDDVETIELDIENVKNKEGEIFGDFTLSVIPKLKLDLVPFDLLSWRLSVSENEEKYGGYNETIAYMRWLMIENCHIEKDGAELLPIVHIDKEAYTESEYHIITNYLEYLGIEPEDLEKQ